jgi:hypothetical protein
MAWTSCVEEERRTACGMVRKLVRASESRAWSSAGGGDNGVGAGDGAEFGDEEAFI